MNTPRVPRAPTEFPLPQIRRRRRSTELEARALALGLPAVLARVIAARAVPVTGSLNQTLHPTLEQLDPSRWLADVERAAQRLGLAIERGEVIGIQTDYDMDGLGAHAAFRTVLMAWGHPPERLRSIVGHRLSEGYGLNAAVAARVLSEDPRPTLLVTADTGSKDERQIALLKDAGIDVIVTDHHGLAAEGPPPSAFACINPQRADCRYPDKDIAGGMTLWLLLREVHADLFRRGHTLGCDRDLSAVLDFVACSTVADCVSLASRNNRAVVDAGLALMNARLRPCWQALAHRIDGGTFRAETIAFQIAPRINARSRLSDPLAALHFLLAADLTEAHRWLDVLDRANEERKAIERSMMDDLLHRAAAEVHAGRSSICLELPHGHPGVQGICSQRLVEVYGRPTLLFSPSANDADHLTGSGRSIEGLDLLGVIERVAHDDPDLIERSGGHKAAVGVTLRREHMARFAMRFESAVRALLAGRSVGPVRDSDGELSPEAWHAETLAAFEWLEPTGRGFEPARFDGRFRVRQVRAIGDGTHLRLLLEQTGRHINAVWFRARRRPLDPLPIEAGSEAHFLYQLTQNTYRGVTNMELRIEARCAPPTRLA